MTLHTKFRPTKFDQVIGQDSIVSSLTAALKKKASRSFLFCGPSGTGKTTLSRIAATVAGSKPNDIQEIDAATYTGIDDMRTIVTGLQFRPMGEGSIKSIIIDECHGLSKSAWGSLLKSIEEPPPWVYWFLCTTELNKVPETIKTRCLRYELKPVSRAELTSLLEDVAKAEKGNFTKMESVIDLCVKEANGSPRQALVNLGVCMDAPDRQAAAELLKSAHSSGEAIDLARALVQRVSWPNIQPVLASLKELNAESVRQVVRAYVTTVILDQKNRENVVGWAMEILDAFSTPFYSGDGISPVVLACGKLLLQ